MAQGFSTPDPSLSPTHLSIKTGRTTTTHYTHHQVSLMVSHNTTLVPSMGLRIGPACEAGLSAGMRMERVPPRIRKKERKRYNDLLVSIFAVLFTSVSFQARARGSPATNGMKVAIKNLLESMATRRWKRHDPTVLAHCQRVTDR